jgi:hypothetical protein
MIMCKEQRGISAGRTANRLDYWCGATLPPWYFKPSSLRDDTGEQRYSPYFPLVKVTSASYLSSTTSILHCHAVQLGERRPAGALCCIYISTVLRLCLDAAPITCQITVWGLLPITRYILVGVLSLSCPSFLQLEQTTLLLRPRTRAQGLAGIVSIKKSILLLVTWSYASLKSEVNFLFSFT